MTAFLDLTSTKVSSLIFSAITSRDSFSKFYSSDASSTREQELSRKLILIASSSQSVSISCSVSSSLSMFEVLFCLFNFSVAVVSAYLFVAVLLFVSSNKFKAFFTSAAFFSFLALVSLIFLFFLFLPVCFFLVCLYIF